MKNKYTVVISKDEESGVYSASVPAIPGCYAWGKTVPEALQRAKEVVEMCLEEYEMSGDPIPVEVTQRVIVAS